MFLEASMRLDAKAQVPQDHAYQTTLRDYLATLSVEDFEITLDEIAYEDSFFTSLDQLHATWILLEDFGRKGTLDMTGLRVAPEHFLLSEIEQGTDVYMRGGRNSGFMDPINTAWWATWDYAGNPHFNSRAVKLRAFVAAAVDMIMTDQDLEASATNQRSDYAGGYLSRFGYVYYVVKDELPANVQAAFEEGLIKFFERQEAYYPYGAGGADLEAFQLPGLWYAAEAINSDNLRTRARARAKFVLEQIMVAGGHYHHHGNDGIDLSYEGILQFYLSWATLLYDDPELTAYLELSSKLKAYQALPEPTGHFFSPSHFNTGTAPGAANDQWHSYQRDHAVAMQTDEAKYLVWGGRVLPEWYLQGVPLEQEMKDEIEAAITRRNEDVDAQNMWAWRMASDNVPGVWRAEHWMHGLAAAHTHYRDGFYDELMTLQSSNSPLTLPPFLRDASFIKEFGGAFVSAKFENYAVVIHIGPTVTSWGNGVPGLSGGSLSAFWTEETGTVLLGKSRGTQNADADQWEGELGWHTWAVNAVSGVDDAGRPFSSARNRNPEVTKVIDGSTAAQITVAGAIGQHDGGLSAPNSAVTGAVNYTREFSLNSSGVSITSEVVSDGSDTVSELWEMIPVFLSDASQGVADAVVEFNVNGNWIAATTSSQDSVTEVRTTRFGESVKIVFEEPRRVKLSSVWTSSQVSSRIQNLMVDLLNTDSGATQMPAYTSVTYTIRPADVYAVGDASGDGAVSAFDAASILQHLIDYEPLDPAGEVAADVSGDGTLTAFDASLILQYLVGLIDCLPAEASCQ